MKPNIWGKKEKNKTKKREKHRRKENKRPTAVFVNSVAPPTDADGAAAAAVVDVAVDSNWVCNPQLIQIDAEIIEPLLTQTQQHCKNSQT